jgi:hypothetical protein
MPNPRLCKALIDRLTDQAHIICRPVRRRDYPADRGLLAWIEVKVRSCRHPQHRQSSSKSPDH